MRILWTPKAEKNLDKIFQHTVQNFSFELAERLFIEIKIATEKISDFPKLGRRIGGYEERRQLVIAGNAIIYEIVLRSSPCIVIRNIYPRRTHQP